VRLHVNGTDFDRIESTQISLGARDIISTATGNKNIIGGGGQDDITTGAGNHIILGDNGLVTYNATGAVLHYETTDTSAATGDADQIRIGGDGDNTVLGGMGGDSIVIRDANSTTPRRGTDTIFGDNGSVDLDAVDQHFVRITSTVTGLGGDDTIVTGDGHKKIVAGYGNDTVTVNDGSHLIILDNGAVDFNSAGRAVDTITIDVSNATGGNDSVVTGEGDNVVLGGVGNDTITLGRGTGNDVVIGDNGRIRMDAAGLLFALIETSGFDQLLGGDDLIDVGAGHNIVLAGFGADRVSSGSGNDIVMGDNGEVVYNAAGRVVSYRSTDTNNATGGNDNIDAGSGNNVIFGGIGRDTVTSGGGSNVVLGDNGALTLDAAGAIYQRVETSGFDAGLGDDDTITLADGDNIVFGGRGNDTITAGNGNDLLFGDNGSASWNASGVLVNFASSDSVDATGGNDVITAGDGTMLAVGGVGRDRITLGNGRKIVFGDAGAVTYNDLGALLIATTTQNALGDDDTITAADGKALVIAGLGSDTVTLGNDNHRVLGDNGYVHEDGTGAIMHLETTDPTLGGDDVVTVGSGDDMVIGGMGSDTLTGNDGRDFLIGDNGRVVVLAQGDGNYSVPLSSGQTIFSSFRGETILVETTDAYAQTTLVEGGPDALDGGAGQDVLFGGGAIDQIVGNLTDDIIAGDYASVTFVGGFLTAFVRPGAGASSSDLISSALEKSFDVNANEPAVSSESGTSEDLNVPAGFTVTSFSGVEFYRVVTLPAAGLPPGQSFYTIPVSPSYSHSIAATNTNEQAAPQPNEQAAPQSAGPGEGTSTPDGTTPQGTPGQQPNVPGGEGPATPAGDGEIPPVPPVGFVPPAAGVLRGRALAAAAARALPTSVAGNGLMQAVVAADETTGESTDGNVDRVADDVAESAASVLLAGLVGAPTLAGAGAARVFDPRSGRWQEAAAQSAKKRAGLLDRAAFAAQGSSADALRLARVAEQWADGAAQAAPVASASATPRARIAWGAVRGGNGKVN